MYISTRSILAEKKFNLRLWFFIHGLKRKMYLKAAIKWNSEIGPSNGIRTTNSIAIEYGRRLIKRRWMIKFRLNVDNNKVNVCYPDSTKVQAKIMQSFQITIDRYLIII